MFEELRGGQAERISIALHTHKGNSIENEIAVVQVSQAKIDQFESLSKRHPRWRHRKPPTGVYNCFGHVWASRRTAVYDKFDEAVLRVLADDGYRMVNRVSETPEVGDVLCYWESVDPRCNCLHVGLVAYTLPRGGLPPEVWILSKWDDTSGEVLHEEKDHPLKAFPNVILEYWTDRPRFNAKVVLP